MRLIEGDCVHSFNFNLLLQFLSWSSRWFFLFWQLTGTFYSFLNAQFLNLCCCFVGVRLFFCIPVQQKALQADPSIHVGKTSTSHCSFTGTFDWTTYHLSFLTKYSKEYSIAFVSFNLDSFSYIKSIKYSSSLKAIFMQCFVMIKYDEACIQTDWKTVVHHSPSDVRHTVELMKYNIIHCHCPDLWCL